MICPLKLAARLVPAGTVEGPDEAFVVESRHAPTGRSVGWAWYRKADAVKMANVLHDHFPLGLRTDNEHEMRTAYHLVNAAAQSAAWVATRDPALRGRG